MAEPFTNQCRVLTDDIEIHWWDGKVKSAGECLCGKANRVPDEPAELCGLQPFPGSDAGCVKPYAHTSPTHRLPNGMQWRVAQKAHVSAWDILGARPGGPSTQEYIDEIRGGS